MPLSAPRFAKSTRLQTASANSPALRRGETSRGVVDLQRALLDLDFALPITTQDDTRPPDGIFGAETESALKKFQSAQGLGPDGVAGRDTLARLDAIFLADDPFFTDPEVAQLRLRAQMTGPAGIRPFAVTTERKRRANR
jgi:peptidoglycan hydrolase-like protein with peptidoglycan-binding domain